jgi:hypothetical protein
VAGEKKNSLVDVSAAPYLSKYSSKFWFYNYLKSRSVFVFTLHIQKDATFHSLFINWNCSTCFGWYIHPSSGAHTTVSTASGICHTVITICRFRGRVGTGLSVLWVAYATHSKQLDTGN